MLWIFSASTEAGSFEQTSRFIGPLLKWLFPAIDPEMLNAIHFGIRKTGHFVQYAILAALLWPACARRWVPVVAISVAYAALDELHQSFVPSRQGSVADVLIDASGAVAAVLVLGWISRRKTRRALHGTPMGV